MDKLDYADMFVDEFREAVDKTPTAFVPLGLLEWHGEHLALGCDLLRAQELCRLLARAHGGVVLPPSYFSCPGFSAFEGTIDFPPEVAAPVLTALFHQLQKVGFRTAVLVSGHGGTPQERMVDAAIHAYAQDGTMRVIPVFAGKLLGGNEKPPHATPRETAVLKAVRPDAVDVSRFTPGKEYEIAYDLGEAYAKRARTWRITDTDIRTQPLHAMGREALDKLVRMVGELLQGKRAP